jgi:hypothetical protein
MSIIIRYGSNCYGVFKFFFCNTMLKQLVWSCHVIHNNLFMLVKILNKEVEAITCTSPQTFITNSMPPHILFTYTL